jgi:2-polyprenyl-6-methoxyphenol hydroxylase-like FAD-dependent oxidoreductase
MGGPILFHQMAQHDVIVIGAGPVGLSLALGLARKGVDVLVLEKEPGTAKHSRAPAIWSGTQKILTGLSVMDRFEAEVRFSSTAVSPPAGAAAAVVRWFLLSEAFGGHRIPPTAFAKSATFSYTKNYRYQPPGRKVLSGNNAA